MAEIAGARQIHDELLFEVSASEIEEVREIVVGVMTSAAKRILRCDIPVVVEAHHNETWHKS